MSHVINHQDDFKRGIDYIGVSCVFFCHDGKGNLLLHKRSTKCRDEIGHWDPGGGALEFGETPEDCVKREVREEYNTDPLKVTLAGARNVLRDNNGTPSHWVAFVFYVLVEAQEVAIGDPEKMEKIGWFAINNLPSPLHSQFLASFELVRSVHQTINQG